MDMLETAYYKYPTASLLVTLSSAYAIYYAVKISHVRQNFVYSQNNYVALMLLYLYRKPRNTI